MVSIVNARALEGTKVFEKIKVGDNVLSNRIVFLPTTRFRAQEDHVPSQLQLRYYDQRSQYPGSLLITEATALSEDAALYPHVPGIWNDSQSKAWKKINSKIHSNGSFSSMQLWNVGRQNNPLLMKQKGYDFVSSSDVYADEKSKADAEAAGNLLRPLTVEEIKEFVNVKYPNAARKALEADFDYIEIHAAHGYLLDQFLQPSANKRNDEYGGSIENRARFILEVVDKLIEVVGAKRLGIRVSPWAQFSGMKGDQEDVHPMVTFGYLFSELQKRADQGNGLAYVSVVEPRFQFAFGEEAAHSVGFEKLQQSKNSNSFVYSIWQGVVLRGGNYSYDFPDFEQSLKDVDDDRTLLGFAKYYTSNPDLVFRLKKGYPLREYQRGDFYTQYNWNYSTFPNYGEEYSGEESAEKLVLPEPISESTLGSA